MGMEQEGGMLRGRAARWEMRIVSMEYWGDGWKGEEKVGKEIE